jgi:NADH:ubiquinone oxidoreductase subunit 5 (subunit L)/multisubunit Na+/H+ antiporter MnhA subunit
VLSDAIAFFDRKAIGGAVDGVGSGVIGSGRQVRRIESGNVQAYLLLLVISIVVLVVVFAR